MQISFTEDQRALRDSMRGFFAARGPVAAPATDPDELLSFWHELAALDLLDVSLPSAGQPDGSKVMDLIPIYLEMGRALSAAPHLETAIVAAGAISRLDPQAELLASITSGDAIVVNALRGADGRASLSASPVTARPDTDSWVLDGESPLVAYASLAQYLLVPARTPDGVCAFLVATDTPNVTLAPAVTLSGLPIFHVHFDGARVNAVARLGDATATAAALGAALARATVLRCAEVAGAGERLLELCVDYSLTREQFGKPIGSYQAVQYLCTDIAIMTRVTLLLAAQAAGLIDNYRPYQSELAAARRYAKTAAAAMVSVAHEVHAGIGFMDEHVLHLYTRRSTYWEAELDDDELGEHSLLDRYAGPGTKGGF